MKTISYFQKLLTATILVLTVGATAALPFIFWLEQPKRSNPFDHKSSLFFPTPTNPATPTPPQSATITPTASPTRTISPTFSASPSFSNSPTDTPYAGSPTDTPTLTITPTATPSGILFEDFEAGTPLSPNYYSGGAAPTSSWDLTQFVSPIYSMKMVVTGGHGTYIGMNILSNYGTINATGALTLDFWMKSDTAYTNGFTVRFSEATIGLENENWRSPNLSIAAGAWIHFSLPLSGFVEDDYGDGSCSGTCSQAGKGNNTMDLAAIDRFEIQFGTSASTATIYLDQIMFGLAPAPTASPSVTPTNYAGTPTFTVTPIPLTTRLFEDFENGALVNPQQWGDSGSGASSSQAETSAQFNSASNSNAVLVTSAGYGAGVNFESNYFNAGGYVDANGAVNLVYYIKADQAITYTVRWKEGTALENGGDLENWVSPTQNYSAVGTWQLVRLTLSGFSEDNYGDGSCQPSCASTGNATMDFQSVKRFEIQVSPAVTGVNIYLDDIFFELPAGTSTPTPVVSTPTPIFTACVPTTGQFGLNSTAGAVSNAGSNLDASQQSITFTCTVENIAVYMGTLSGGPVSAGVYSDAGGKPGTLLTWGSITPTASSWNVITVTPVTIAPGTYWLAYLGTIATVNRHYGLGTANPAMEAYYWGTPANLPAIWDPTFTGDGTGGVGAVEWVMYVNTCP